MRTRPKNIHPYAQVITVAKSGGDFNTIQSAIDSITDNASDKRYCVLVYPGTYTETITGEEYVDIVGVDRHACRIQDDDPETGDYTTITLPEGAGLYNITAIVTAAGLNAKRVVAVAGDNVSVVGCDLLGGNQAVYGDASTTYDNPYIADNYSTAANPYWGNFDGLVLVNNTNVWSGSVTACTALVDMGQTVNSIIAHNTYRGVNASSSSTAYVFAAGLGGNLVAYNYIDATSAIEGPMGMILVPSDVAYAAGPTGVPDRLIGNTVRYHATHATPQVAAVWVNYANGDTDLAPVYIQDNTLVATADNAWAAAYSVYTYDSSGSPLSDPASIPTGAGAVITTDRKSLSMGIAGQSWAEARHASITWIENQSGIKRSAMQIHMNVAAAADDSVWSTAAGYSEIDLSATGWTMLIDGSSDQIVVSPARCLRVTGGQAGANGTVRIHGWDIDGRYQYEDFVVSGTTDIEGAKAFATLWYFDVTVAGDAGKTATIGVNNLIGLREPILATADALYMAVGDGSAARPVMATAGASVVANRTVNVGAISANDEIEIYYLTPV